MIVPLVAALGLSCPQEPFAITTTARKQVAAVHQQGQQVTRIEIDYGVPIWREAFGATLKRSGRLQLRLGRDGWTTLTTTASLQFDDATIPAGIWVLGLVRDRKSQWHLMATRALAATLRGQHPARTRDVRPEVLVALEHGKGNAKPELEIGLTPVAGHSLRLRLEMAWHEHRLTTTCRVRTPLPPPAAPPFSRVRDGNFAIERMGRDRPSRRPHPQPDHVILFTIWNKDGTLVDSAHARRDPQITPPSRLHPTWQRHLARIGPGGRIRFETERHVIVLDLIELRPDIADSKKDSSK